MQPVPISVEHPTWRVSPRRSCSRLSLVVQLVLSLRFGRLRLVVRPSLFLDGFHVVDMGVDASVGADQHVERRPCIPIQLINVEMTKVRVQCGVPVLPYWVSESFSGLDRPD